MSFIWAYMHLWIRLFIKSSIQGWMALRSRLFAPLNVHQLHREHTDGGELGRKAAGRPAVVSAVNVQHKKSCMIFLRASASGTCHLRLNLRSQSSSVARGVCSSGKGKSFPLWTPSVWATVLCRNHALLLPYYGHGYYSERDSSWLFPKDEPCLRSCDPSLQTESQRAHYQIRLEPIPCLPGRRVEWISLCTAEASITVIPLQSAGTLRGRWKEREERVAYSPCVSPQRARGGEVGGISGLSRQLLSPTPAPKRTKD